MPSYVPAKRATAYVTYVSLIDQASGKVFKVNPTLAAGDVQVSIDGGTFANLATLPVVTPTGSRLVKVSLSAAEMTGDTISVLFSDVAGAEWNDLLEVIDTAQRQIDDLAFPTVAGRALDVTATGAAGIDWGNVENPSTAVALSATTISSSQVVASVTGAVGSVTGAVGSVTGNVGGNVNGSVAVVGPGGISSGSFALGAINAAAIAADAIGASELAADAVAEIADQVWDEVLAGHLTAGSTGAALNAGAAASDPWATALPGAYGAGTAGNIIGTRVDVAVSTRLAPTVAARTLDVTATGAAGIDWGNVENPTTALNLSATNIDPDQVVAAVTGAVGSVTGAVGSVTGSVGGSVAGSVGSVAANGITAASIATGAIDADALATDAVNEIADGVWDEPLAGHLTAGSTGAALNGAGSAGDPWTTPLPGAYGRGMVGNIVGSRLDVAVSTRLAPTVPGRTLDVTTTGEAGLDWGNIGAPTTVQGLSGTTLAPSQVVASVTGSVGSVTGSVGSVTGAVGSVTGHVGGNVTGSVGSIATNGITAASLDPSAGAEIADAVWDEALAGHLAAGSTGAALNAAGAAGDPWAAPLPGAYGAGTAGFIVGTNVNATVSSRATQVSVDTLTTFVDTEVAAVKAKTDALPADPADNSDILAAIAAVPAAPTALVIADTLLNRDLSAVSETNPRSPLNALRFLRNKWSVAAGVLTVTKENDTATAWTATLTTDAAALPVTASDPT